MRQALLLTRSAETLLAGTPSDAEYIAFSNNLYGADVNPNVVDTANSVPLVNIGVYSQLPSQSASALSEALPGDLSDAERLIAYQVAVGLGVIRNGQVDAEGLGHIQNLWDRRAQHIPRYSDEEGAQLSSAIQTDRSVIAMAGAGLGTAIETVGDLGAAIPDAIALSMEGAPLPGSDLLLGAAHVIGGPFHNLQALGNSIQSLYISDDTRIAGSVAMVLTEQVLSTVPPRWPASAAGTWDRSL